MWRAVLDYAALTSALLNPHGSSARLLDFAHQGRLRIFITPGMVANVGRALRSPELRRRHGMSSSEISELLAELPVLFCMVQSDDRARGNAGTEDDLLFCATQGRADYLVTSLPLNTRTAAQEGTQMVTADQLVKLIGRNT